MSTYLSYRCPTNSAIYNSYRVRCIIHHKHCNITFQYVYVWRYFSFSWLNTHWWTNTLEVNVLFEWFDKVELWENWAAKLLYLYRHIRSNEVSLVRWCNHSDKTKLFWGQLHNQGFTLSVNPYNCSPNFEWLTVLFKQIQLVFFVDS